MLKRIVLTLIFLFFGTLSSVSAKDYYVSNSGNNSNSGSQESPWKTIQYAVDHLSPGDTLKIVGGTYYEHVVQTKGGTAEKPITITAENLDKLPVVSGQGRTNQWTIQQASHITLDHLKFSNYKSGGIVVNGTTANVTGIKIQNNVFTNQDASVDGVIGFRHVIVFNGDSPYSVSHSRITNNYIENVKTGKPTSYNETITMHHNANYNVIEGNTIKNGTFIGIDMIGRDYRWGKGYAHHNVIRNNTVDSMAKNNGGVNVAYYTDGAEYILFENNIAKNTAGIATGAEAWNSLGSKTEYKGLIIRNNVVDGINSNSPRGLMFGSDDASAYKNADPYAQQRWLTDSSAVHNYIKVDMPNYSGYAYKWYYSKRVRVKNNVFINLSGTMSQSLDQPTPQDWKSDGNLWYTNSTPRWSWPKSSYTNFSNYQTATKQDPNGIFTTIPPKIVGGDNYHIKPNTIGDNDGVNLTTTKSSGSGTTVPVNDAKYFYDGWGIEGEVGDRIKIGGKEARITKINYDTNTLTIDRSLTWSNATPVNYYYEGSAPNIGLLPDSFYDKETTPTPTPSPTFNPKFDLNDDGKVDIKDIIELIRFIFG